MNKILKFLTGKEIILYIPHRQTTPIARNEPNKKKYLFIPFGLLFKILYMKGSRIGEFFLFECLNILNPKFILSINWITRKEQLLYLWCKRNRPSQFIVVQHGIYYGGIVTDIKHKFMHCDLFLVWSNFFKESFNQFNPTRKNNIIIFGNPVYNEQNRPALAVTKNVDKILILFSYLSDEDIIKYSPIIDKIFTFTKYLYIKYHNKQKSKFIHKSLIEITGTISSIASDFDIIIADHSTALIDMVFQQKKIIYIDREAYDTIYEQYLKNIFDSILDNNLSLEQMISHQDQEKLFKHLVSLKDNNLQNVIKCQN